MKRKEELPLNEVPQFPLLLQSPFIQLQTREGMYNLQLKDIRYCSSDNSLTTFYTHLEKPIIVSKPIKHFQQVLRKYGFARAHNKRLVNLMKIKCCRQGEDGYQLELVCGKTIGVSRAMKKNIADALRLISVENGAAAEMEKTNGAYSVAAKTA